MASSQQQQQLIRYRPDRQDPSEYESDDNDDLTIAPSHASSRRHRDGGRRGGDRAHDYGRDRNQDRDRDRDRDRHRDRNRDRPRRTRHRSPSMASSRSREGFYYNDDPRQQPRDVPYDDGRARRGTLNTITMAMGIMLVVAGMAKLLSSRAAKREDEWRARRESDFERRKMHRRREEDRSARRRERARAREGEDGYRHGERRAHRLIGHAPVDGHRDEQALAERRGTGNTMGPGANQQLPDHEHIGDIDPPPYQIHDRPWNDRDE